MRKDPRVYLAQILDCAQRIANYTFSLRLTNSIANLPAKIDLVRPEKNRSEILLFLSNTTLTSQACFCGDSRAASSVKGRLRCRTPLFVRCV